MRTAARLLVACIGVAACTNDYESFEPSRGGGGGGGAVASSSTGATGGGAGGSTSSHGGAGGTGGASGGAGGSGGEGGSTASQGGGGGAGGGCSAKEKLCGSTCVSVEDPAFGCADVGCMPCGAPSAQTDCKAGACAVASCDAPFDDCDLQYANGCETDLTSDEANCGKCGTACAGGECVASACVICGDGTLGGAEQCDDDNLLPGDGCSPTCQNENPDDCPGTSIPLDPGTFTISATTAGANDTMQDTGNASPCSGSYPGGDLIYAVTPSVNGTLTATLTASFSDHFLRVRFACPSGQVLDCDYSSSSGTADVISFPVTAGQTYYVVVDSYGNTSGTFTLVLQL